MKLSKMLLPIHAKKAWKNLTGNLHSKFNKLKNSRFIKATTHRLLSSRFFHFLIPFTRRALRKSPPYSYYQNGYHYQYRSHDHVHKRFSTVCIDDLFDEPMTVHSSSRNVCAKGETSRAREELHNKPLPEDKSAVDKSSGIYSVEDIWKQVVARSPQLRSVDERAEEFITEFKEDMKIQREKSLLEFQDMLKRSV